MISLSTNNKRGGSAVPLAVFFQKVLNGLDTEGRFFCANRDRNSIGEKVSTWHFALCQVDAFYLDDNTKEPSPCAEAVPDSAARQLRVVSAYMKKANGSTDQVLNMPQSDPQLTPEMLHGANTPVAEAILPQEAGEIKTKRKAGDSSKPILLDDTVADDILRDRSAVNFLTRRGGLELTSDMTQAEKRRAVQEAVERVTAVQEETVLPEGEASTIIEVDEAPFTIGTSLGAKAKNYDVMDLESGEMYHFVEGSKIQDVNIFAGKGSHIPFRKASFFAQRYGGVAEDWQHVKGYALLETSDGDRMAEVHWVQCGEIGKFEFFVKEWLD